MGEHVTSYASDKEYNESGDNPNPPKVGSFYWVIPNFDVDFVSPEWEGDGDPPFNVNYNHWSQQEQPARFDGYTANGNEKWIMLGIKEPDKDDDWWGVRWISRDEITNSLTPPSHTAPSPIQPDPLASTRPTSDEPS